MSERIYEFMTNNMLLCGAFLAIVVGLLLNELLIRLRSGKRLSARELVQLLNESDNTMVVDVREPADFKKGHIAEAMSLPASKVKDQLDAIVEKVKGNPVVVCCAMGSSSSRVVTALKGAGVETVYSLKGGVAAWETDGLPLTTK